ncbi:MAG: hypothetical protein ACQESK_01190 [Bacteroidota bacterium]
MISSRLHKYLILIFIIIISFLLVKNHVQSYQKENFYAQKFDLSKTKDLNDLGEVAVLKFSEEEIIIKKDASKDIDLKPHHYYSFNHKGKQYTFTFEHLIDSSEQIKLRYLVWFFTKPPFFQKKVDLKEVKLHQNLTKKEKDIHFITDAFGCCLLEGKKFRYFWEAVNSSLNFVGIDKDIYGYSYTGYKDVQSKLSAQDFSADYTIFWLGRSNLKRATSEILTEIEMLEQQVLKKNPSTKLYVLTPAPSPVAFYDKKIDSVTTGLKENYDSQIIDVNQFIKQQPDWKNKMFYKDYGLSEEAYKLVIQYIDEQLF